MGPRKQTAAEKVDLALLAERRRLRDVLAALEAAATEHANEHGCSGDLGARLSDARAVLSGTDPSDWTPKAG